uniref:Uncharacterized protein n=1 Tax=Coturnix japonica TaxID=93934 RepID=A0A8C2TDQ9_COTJA
SDFITALKASLAAFFMFFFSVFSLLKCGQCCQGSLLGGVQRGGGHVCPQLPHKDTAFQALLWKWLWQLCHNSSQGNTHSPRPIHSQWFRSKLSHMSC